VALRAEHKEGKKWMGINVFDRKVDDMYKLDVVEPVLVKKQVIKSAVEAAAMILKIDDVIAASKIEEKGKEKEGKEESFGEEE
ncbi:MAG: thermosome subunit, partial [Thaumarchaeota archaeon]